MTEIPRYAVGEGSWAIARLPPEAPVPAWASGAAFSSVTRTAEELSIVCAEAAVPAGVRAERGWAMIRLEGPFAFTQTGILASILGPLARAGVSIAAISTFDTDYVLVKRTQLHRAVDALEKAREEERSGRERPGDRKE